MTEYISFFLSFLALGMVARGSSVMVGKDPSSLPVTNHFNMLTFNYIFDQALFLKFAMGVPVLVAVVSL